MMTRSESRVSTCTSDVMASDLLTTPARKTYSVIAVLSRFDSGDSTVVADDGSDRD